MSQNAHTLLLFFNEEKSYRKCQKILKYLEADRAMKAAQHSEEWGVDLPNAWNDDWFNHNVTSTSKFIRVYYETSTSYDLPLALLQQLFDVGLRVACLDVFYDQVGETGQFYFLEGQLVSKKALLEKYGLMQDILDQEFGSEVDASDSNGYKTPRTISKLLEDKQLQESESKEMLDSMLELARTVRETGQLPSEIYEEARAALVLRALIKGVLQSVAFGVVTILLFKGVWLWIGLSIILLIILPLIYVNKVAEEYPLEDEEDEEDEEEERVE